MAGRIQGITIEIDGNATGLDKALKGVDKTLKTTQNNLRDVNKLLKLDPGNTELLVQKQKNLEKAIDTTKGRLEELKKAQGGVAEGSEEWDGLQREIIATEQNLQKLEGEYRNFGSVAAQQIAVVGEKMEKVGSGIETVGKGMSTYVTAPVVAGFTAAAKTTADFDSAMSQVAATMGVTTDEIQDLREFAKQMGAETAFSASEAAQALNYMALAGYDAATSMQMLPVVLNLAAAGGIDLATASDMVTDAQSALGLSLDETTAMVDQMAAASSKSNTSVQQLGEAYLKIGATARNMQGGTQELATVLGVLADNGIKGAEGGTHLRNILLSLQSAVEDGAVNFGDFSVSVYDSDGNMRSMVDIIGDIQSGMGDMSQEAKDALLSGVFNKTDLAAVNALLGTSSDRFEELGSAIGESNGAAQAMADTQLDNLNGQLTLLKSAVEGLAISVGEIIMPVIRKAVDKVQGVVDWLNNLNDEQKQTIVRVAAVAAAIGPLLIGVGKLTVGFSKLAQAAPDIVKGAKLIKGVLSLKTLGITALIVGVVAAGVFIYKNWDKIVAWTKDMVEKVKTWFNNMKTSITNTVNNIKTSVVNTWNNIKTAVTNAVNGIKTTVTTIWNSITTAVSTAINNTKTAVSNGWDNIKSAVSNAVNGVKSTVSGAWESVKTATANFVQSIKDKFNFTLKLPDIKLPSWEDIKTKLNDIIQKIKDLFKWDWKLPDIKLPHFNVKGGVAPYGLGGKGSLPSISIDWYRKAYQNPVMFTNPTVLATPAGYKGFGDGHGAEIVMGLNNLRELVGTSQGDVTINVYGTPGMNTDELARAVEQKLVALQKRRNAVYA